MPRLAGRNGVPYRRFALWHTPSAILWAVWMVGAKAIPPAGAGYQALAARAGHAAGALAALTLIIGGLLLAGRRLPSPVRVTGRMPVPHRTAARWHPAVLAVAGLALLTTVALALIEVIPPIVRFSGLASADDAVAGWARGQWTSDGYRFAVSTATTLAPEVPLALSSPSPWPAGPGAADTTPERACWPRSARCCRS